MRHVNTTFFKGIFRQEHLPSRESIRYYSKRQGILGPLSTLEVYVHDGMAIVHNRPQKQKK